MLLSALVCAVDAGVARELEKHVPRIVHISSSPMTPMVPNVIHGAESLDAYSELLGVKL